MARLSRHLWGGTSLKMAAKEARYELAHKLCPIKTFGTEVSLVCKTFLLIYHFYQATKYSG